MNKRNSNVVSPLSSVAKKQGLDDTIDYEVSENMNITPNDSFQACDASITKALNAFLLGDSARKLFSVLIAEAVQFVFRSLKEEIETLKSESVGLF